jgi:hypothetical protein
MSQFIQRVANYIANEVLIKGLANSKTFQRFAIRTDHNLQNLHKTGTEHFEKAFEDIAKTQVRGSSSSARGPPQAPLRGFPGFVSAFFKEIRRDLTGK